jgi:hypothetical protein
MGDERASVTPSLGGRESPLAVAQSLDGYPPTRAQVSEDARVYAALPAQGWLISGEPGARGVA